MFCCNLFLLLVFPSSVQQAEIKDISVTAAAKTFPAVFVKTRDGFTVSNATLNIKGTFTINKNLSVTNCALLLDTNAKIIITPGKTLSLISEDGQQTILKAKEKIMWDGIYIADKFAHLTTTSGGGLQTTIQEAQNAIVSNNGGDFFIDNTLLANNNIDIIVNPYSGNHTGYIARSTFTSSSVAMHPYVPINGIFCQNLFTQTYQGIQINRVANITIGDASSLSLKNTFKNMDFGIWSSLSKVQVYNNTFQNVFASLSPLFGVGVYAEGGRFPFPPPPMGLTVGGTGLQVNTFLNCQRGVKVQIFLPSLIVKGNTFTDNRDFAVSVFQCGSNPLSITNNFINNTSSTGNLNNGIILTNVAVSNTNISNNIISQPAGSNQPSAGVTVQNVNLSNLTLNVWDNSITNKRTGILLIGITGTAQPLVKTNTVTITNPFSPTTINYYGIRIQNCTGLHAKQNTISSNIIPAFTMVSTLRGISVENSPQSIIGSNNQMTQMGSGIYCDGSNPSSKLACNNFTSCWNGIYFFNADVGNQLSAGPNGIAQRNQWFTNASTDGSDGNVTTATNFWYKSSPASYNPDPSIFLAGSGFFAQTTTDNTNACALYIVPPPAQQHLSAATSGNIREDNFGAIARNQKQFAQNQYEFRFADREFAHRFFRYNPDMLTLGAPDDTVFINFYNTQNSGNLGAFADVMDSIDQQNIQQAVNINSAIVPNNIIESNRKVVNNIYLRTWANGIFAFTPADSNALFNIAMQQPLIEGDAVYSARVMLGIDPANLSNRTMNENAIEKPVANNKNCSAKIYPNPTEEEATLDYVISENENGSLEIYSVLGEKITSFKLKPQERLTFATTGIQSGIYFYKVILNEENINSGKLVIIK